MVTVMSMVKMNKDQINISKSGFVQITVYKNIKLMDISSKVGNSSNCRKIHLALSPYCIMLIPNKVFT